MIVIGVMNISSCNDDSDRCDEYNYHLAMMIVIGVMNISCCNDDSDRCDEYIILQ